MVRFVPIASVLASVIVAGSVRLKLTVSPAAALAIASRSEPEPLSLVLVTVIVAAKAFDDHTPKQTNSNVMPRLKCFIRIKFPRFVWSIVRPNSSRRWRFCQGTKVPG